MASATGVLTFTGQPLNTETVVVGTKTYTFQTTLTDVDGNVEIGADVAESIDNLYAAINLAGGTGYAASMTANNEAYAMTETDTVLTCAARANGTIGNYVPTTETLTNGSWGAATMENGTGQGVGDVDYTNLRDNSNFGINAGVIAQLNAWIAG